MTTTEVNQLPPVSSLLLQAFFLARAKHQNLHREWTNLSGILAGRFALTVATINLQLQGDLDLLLRSLEDEHQSRRLSEAPDTSNPEFTSHYQKMLSETWIIGCYEIFRAFRQRDRDAKKRNIEPSGISEGSTFASILADLALLRMPIAKYEIPNDTRMDKPLHLQAHPSNGDATDDYVYDKNDPTRFHLMQSAISSRGSLMWLAIEHSGPSQRWLERRELSDRLLALGREVIPAGILEAQRAAGL